MAAVGHFRASKNSRVTVVATNLRHANWKTTYKGDDLDTNNFEETSDQGTIGILGVDWSTGGNYDAQQNPYDSPPGFYPRDDLGQITFYENKTDANGWVLATNRVLSAENGAEVKGLVTFSASGKSQGCALGLGGGSQPTGSF